MVSRGVAMSEVKCITNLLCKTTQFKYGYNSIEKKNANNLENGKL